MTNNKELYSICEGKIFLGDKEISCAVLSNETRVITETAIFEAFGRTSKGLNQEKKKRLQNLTENFIIKEDFEELNSLPRQRTSFEGVNDFKPATGKDLRPRANSDVSIPAFLAALSLQPFISQDLKEYLVKVEYTTKTGGQGKGYDARIIPQICKMYLNAREAGALRKTQEKFARMSEIILMALSNLGIVALVDEATGYQTDRNKIALQQILDKYIAKELQPWQKKFPDNFYTEMFRLKGWDFERLKRKPKCIGSITNSLIYKRLPEGVLNELKNSTPKSEAGNYTARLHQSLTPEVGNTHLQKQIEQVVTLFQVSETWDDFQNMFDRIKKVKPIYTTQLATA